MDTSSTATLRKTELVIIADDSGSMGPMKKESEQALRRLVADQKSIPGDVRLTLVRFNTDVMTPIAARPLDKVDDGSIELHPSGLTALYDAVGITLEGVGHRIANEKWADLVIIAVLTDGAENASKRYTQEQVQSMVSHAEKNGWRFIFLAANQDAWKAAASIGTQSNMVSNFAATGQGVQAAYDSLSASTRSLRTGA